MRCSDEAMAFRHADTAGHAEPGKHGACDIDLFGMTPELVMAWEECTGPKNYPYQFDCMLQLLCPRNAVGMIGNHLSSLGALGLYGDRGYQFEVLTRLIL